MTQFKICGLNDFRNASAAIEAGADFLGFVFVPDTRRQILVEKARDIIQECRKQYRSDCPRIVGLFADQPLKEINHTIKTCGLNFAQLCGQEAPSYWELVDSDVIKQIRVGDAESLSGLVADVRHQIGLVVGRGCTPLLDKNEPGLLGGTGRTFNWRIAAGVSSDYDLVLAGGLTPGNVGQAIETLSPWGVDVSSGVEENGEKTPGKIRAFALAVRQADRIVTLNSKR